MLTYIKNVHSQYYILDLAYQPARKLSIERNSKNEIM